jgi:DNA-binding HxlR family transcriptional regulator
MVKGDIHVDVNETMHSRTESGQHNSSLESRRTGTQNVFDTTNDSDLTRMSELLGKKWHPVIVKRLLDDGPQGFSALQDSIGEISSKVLSESLEKLEEAEVVEREIISERPFRVEYSLTASGEDLEPIINAMGTWSRQYT